MAPAKKSNATNSRFNDDDRQQLKEINETIKKLVLNEIRDLKSELAQNKKELKDIKMENAKLKQALNVNIFSTDAIDQYGRRTNIRIHGVPKNTTEKDDGEEIVKEIAMELGIKLQDWDVQRAHRLGRKRPNSTRKPRPINARFLNHKTRTHILKEKSKLKKISKIPQYIPNRRSNPLANETVPLRKRTM